MRWLAYETALGEKDEKEKDPRVTENGRRRIDEFVGTCGSGRRVITAATHEQEDIAVASAGRNETAGRQQQAICSHLSNKTCRRPSLLQRWLAGVIHPVIPTSPHSPNILFQNCFRKPDGIATERQRWHTNSVQK